VNFQGHENLEARWSDYKSTVARWGLRHFQPREFIGPLRWADRDRSWPDDMPTHWPPYPELVGNLEETAVLADEIRHQWSGPVKVVSGWRPPAYNDIKVGGAEDSMHLSFRALDLQPVGEFDTREWIEHVEKVVHAHRQHQSFSIGLGRYWHDDDKFVHIDTGYYSYHRNWHLPDDPR